MSSSLPIEQFSSSEVVAASPATDIYKNRNRMRALVSRLALIFIIALTFRSAIFVSRLTNDPTYTNWTKASDQAVYIAQARQLLEGKWPNGEFWFQPGNVVWLALWIGITRNNLFAVQCLTFVFGSLGTFLVFIASSQMSGSIRVGLIGALLYALYPVSAFFDTTMLTAPADGLFAAACLASISMLLRRPHYGWAILSGVLFGFAALIRTNVLAMLPVAWLALWFAHTSLRHKVALGAVMCLVIVIALAPAAWWNTTQTGRFNIVSTAGPYLLYKGNNRDSMGVGETSQAFRAVRATDQDWNAAIIRDIRAEPLHTLGLYFRKLGLVWGNLEIPNIVGYVEQGLDNAPILYISPLSFRVLSFLGIVGGILAFRDRNSALLAFVAATLYSLALAVAFVVSRYRMPMIPALCIAAAFGLRQVIARRESLKTILSVSGAAIILLLALAVARENLPFPRFQVTAQVPADFTPTDLRFGNSLRLLGYRLDQPDVSVNDPMLITLLWQAEHTPDRDYSVFVKLIDSSGNEAGNGDTVIGTVSWPFRPLTTWPDGAVFREQVLVRAKKIGAPVVWLGVYDKGDFTRLPVNDSQGGIYPDNATILTRVRIIDPEAPQPRSPDHEVSARFGDGIYLTGYSLSTEELRPGDRLTLTFLWEVTAPPSIDASLFIHLIDSNGTLTAQTDGPPIEGLLPTSLWRTGDRWEDKHTLTLPSDLQPGDYTVHIGLYNWSDGVRLPVSDAGALPVRDQSLTLTTITYPGN